MLTNQIITSNSLRHGPPKLIFARVIVNTLGRSSMTEQSSQSGPEMDNPEAYTQPPGVFIFPDSRLYDGRDFTERSQEFSDAQKNAVIMEAELYGIDPAVDPDGFVEQHVHYIEAFEASLRENFPDVKEQIIDYIASYFSKTDAGAESGLKRRMKERLAATNVSISDGLKYDHPGGEKAVFNPIDRQIYVDSSTVSWLAYQGEDGDTESFTQSMYWGVLAHEIMHGLFVGGTQQLGSVEHWPIRNGLMVDAHTDTSTPISETKITHARWLNEAVIESFRKDMTNTDIVFYEIGVAFLDTLNELSPGLRDTLFLAALNKQGPGPVFGTVEALIGPTGIEQVGEILAKIKSLDDLNKYESSLLNLVSEDQRPNAIEIFSIKKSSILTTPYDGNDI